jgi:large subunit ribosomal protein L24
MLFRKTAPTRQKMHVKKGDKVVVLSGQYKGNEPHEVLKVLAREGKILVQGVNLRWKHQKRSQQNPKGGRIQTEHPIQASKVLLFSEQLGKGTRTRSEVKDGKTVRIGVKCGTNFG